MRTLLFLIIIVNFLFGCNKNNFNDPDFDPLIGIWDSDADKQEKYSISFFKDGTIKIENSGERSKTFKVSKILKSHYLHPINKKDTLDSFIFQGNTKSGMEVNFGSLVINSKRDSIFLNKNQIIDFDLDLFHLTILTRK